MVITEKATLTVKECASYIGVSENKMYQMLLSGEIPARRAGRKWLISRLFIDKWLERI